MCFRMSLELRQVYAHSPHCQCLRPSAALKAAILERTWRSKSSSSTPADEVAVHYPYLVFQKLPIRTPAQRNIKYFKNQLKCSVADPGWLFRIRFFPSRTTGPGLKRSRIRIRIKEFKYFWPTKLIPSCQKYGPGCSSRTWFFSIPDQAPQHCWKLTRYMARFIRRKLTITELHRRKFRLS